MSKPARGAGGQGTIGAGDAYIGVMSGTSLDGVSACVVRFGPTYAEGGGRKADGGGRMAEGGRRRADGGDRASHTPSTPSHQSPITSHQSPVTSPDSPVTSHELSAFVTRPFTPAQRARLLAAMQGGTAAEYSALAFELGAWLADAALAALVESGVPKAEVRAVGSHGQTLWHDAPRSTWQLGESAVIAERLGIDVVSDFRVRDVAAGGQGAPLVPVADALLFAGQRWRALQNIGGIGNVTIVPPGGDLSGVRAFDTGPGVAVIDGVVRAVRPDQAYDRDGAMARAGTPVDEVVTQLLAHPYFAASPPKSTGRELFSADYVAALVRECRARRSGCSDDDIVATATALTARSIGDAYRRFMPEPVDEVLVSGGGARNAVLMELIAREVAPKAVRRFDEVFYDGDAKECVAFALLAKLFIEGRPANVPSATGSRGPRILGKLTPAKSRS